MHDISDVLDPNLTGLVVSRPSAIISATTRTSNSADSGMIHQEHNQQSSSREHANVEGGWVL
jgi:hypothetical protein